MLHSIHIENFVFIEKLELEFSPGLNMFTGETGSGKSMVFGAMMVGLGGKASADLLRLGADKLRVVLNFSNLKDVVKQKIKNAGVDCQDGILSIKREVMVDGKTRCLVNGELFPVAKLKELAPLLVDVHSQHQQQYLLDEDVHILFYDSFCNLKRTREEYLEIYYQWKEKNRALQKLRAEKQKLAEQKEFLLFSSRELQENLIDEKTYQSLKSQLTVEMQKTKQLNIFSDALQALQSQVVPALEKIKKSFANAKENPSAHAPSANKENSTSDPSKGKVEVEGQRLEKSLENFEQSVDDLKSLVEQKCRLIDVVVDVDEMNRKLAGVERLMRKYGMGIADLLKKQEEVEKSLELIEHGGEQEAELKKQCQHLLREAFRKALALHVFRKNEVPQFEKKIYEQTSLLGMEQSKLIVSLSPDEVKIREQEKQQEIETMLSAHGVSKLCFLFRSSKERNAEPLKKIASGGEISRLMLALKTLLNEKIFISTMLFDEVDTGIGGEVANQVGLKLRELSEKRQVIVITHLAQIARFADRHFRVLRNAQADKTVVDVTVLRGEQVIKEIARMLGEENSQASQKLAEEMVFEAHGTKSPHR